MTDISTDDPSDPEQGSDKPTPDAGQWQPATDAGREAPPDQDAPKRRKSAPAGDQTLRRRPAPSPTPAPTESPEAPSPEEQPQAEETFAGERIAKAIARAGLASRRDAEAMILEGR